MKRFAALFEEMDSTTSTNAKVAAMASYFRAADPRDAAWALFFLTGQRIKRLVPTRVLVDLTLDLAAIPEWLLNECYSAVGDLAETMSLLAEGRQGPADHTPAGERKIFRPSQPGLFDRPPDHPIPPSGTGPAQAGPGPSIPLHIWVEERLLPLRGLSPAEQREAIGAWWTGLDRAQLFLVIKLLTGGFRVGVSRTLVVRALAEVADAPTPVIEHRLMGTWSPTPEFLQELLAPEAARETADGDPETGTKSPASPTDQSRPYPFYLASQITADELAALGDLDAWLVEWKWDGIRSQLIRRGGAVYLWSRGEELITDRFPEIADAAARLPDGVVLDGEVLAFGRDKPMPFAKLQRRIGRTNLTSTALREAPAVFMAYDVLEFAGADQREQPLHERRATLEALFANATPRLRISAKVQAPDWPALAQLRAESRGRGVEGLMLKRLDSPYGVGRRRGDWWKWKIDPYAIDTVLVYAQPGHGRRANLLTDYTFAVWDQNELTPIAKAYSGLDQEEIAELDKWIRQHTTERFGPVRAVEPIHVFELHFEAIAASTRHRSGIAVRFPRIARWRKDKSAAEADTIESVRRLLASPGEGGSPPLAGP